jgi:uncharacterized protein (DUF1810 family)
MKTSEADDRYNLGRFVDAQLVNYADALSEIKSGRKRSHWMWYVFPQVAGLGNSEYTKLYAIRDRNEAEAYLQHPLLVARIHEICLALLQLEQSDALLVFGSPDHLKLKSSMTLFASVPSNDNAVFKQVLDKFFAGQMDTRTLEILGNDLSTV